MVTEQPKKQYPRAAVNFTLERTVISAIEEIAWQRRTNRSRLVNEILTLWLQANDASLASGSQ